MSVTATTPLSSSDTGRVPAPRPRTRTAGRLLTGAVAAFLVLDAAGKLVRADFAVEATERLGFAAHHVVLIGALLAVGVVLHLAPRTAFLGAVYLTAYLGGAVAAHVRTDNPGSVAFTVVFALALWAGYALREPRVRQLAGL